MICIDAIWLATEAVDTRAGTAAILARVVKVFGAARAHHARLFDNKSSARMKVLVYDGFEIWLAARRSHKGRFVWTHGQTVIAVALNQKQIKALVIAQVSLLDEAISADVAAIEAELDQLHSNPARHKERERPKRAPLPVQLPSTNFPSSRTSSRLSR